MVAPVSEPLRRPRIVLCSRELAPFGGGGIGMYVARAAAALSPVADVTILTADYAEADYRRLSAEGDQRVRYGGATVAFVAAPPLEAPPTYYSHMHAYSHRVLERLRELFGDAGPELIEFPDYLGEGFITTQARRAADPFLARTTVAVRLHTSAEMCDVLNGYLEPAFDWRITHALERRTLQDADLLVDSGGDIRGTYERFYGERLAPRRLVRHPMSWSDSALHPRTEPVRAGPLRLLYVGRCERRKGLQDLVHALTGLAGEWRLTVLGADTTTAPLGASMRRTLELQAGGDPRIRLLPPVPTEEVAVHMAEHDAVVLPSRWECWPYAALDAFDVGLPVIGTAVGGLVELIAPGVTGWLAGGTGAVALADVLGPLVDDPSIVRARPAPEALVAHLELIADDDELREAYLDLAGQGPIDSRAPAGVPPLVSIVIPYFGMAAFLGDAVRSAHAQTHPRIEVIVVNDGSFAPEDVVLAELATVFPLRVISSPNGGLGAARNLGIGQARGRYVLPLDADNILEPTFAARCVALLEADDELAYVTSWNRFVDETGAPYPGAGDAYRPVGNWTSLNGERNLAGDGTAVLRRSSFTHHAYSEALTSYEDWALYRVLAQAGQYGRVIPEQLFRYRIRSGSMLREVGLRHEERLRGEIEAHLRDRESTWTSKNG